jgi:molybdate transport system substrate-binding protein
MISGPGIRRILIGVLAAAALAGCGSGSSNGAASPSSSAVSGTVSVFAAASLTESFKTIGVAFQQLHPGVTLRFNFAGTPTLLTQIEQGAQADVFASADTANMDKLVADGYAVGTPATFAHNKLEVVVAAGNPKNIKTLADLAKPGVIYISEAPSVPAGKYSLQALAKAGVTATPKSLETDVKSVISKIELGEADAGIVYTTDVRAAAGKVQGIPIPDSFNVVATYPLVKVKDSSNAAAAAAFIAYLRSPEGQAKLESFGFLPE